MFKKGSSGFTLIELLAVIVILAVIMIIATPTVMEVIDDAKKGTFKNSAHGIVKSAVYNHSLNLIDGKKTGEITYTYNNGVETSEPDGHVLDYSGNKPKNGSVIVNSDGDVKLALHDGTYCAEKAYEDSEITITTKTVEECIGSTLPTDEIEKNYFVNNVNDDGWTEETSEKNFYNNDNNVRVGYASSYRSLWVKWNNIDIPKGSIVKSAKIKFKSSDSPSGDMDQYTKTILYFNNVGNAVAPLNFDDMENKNKTTNNVTWEMPETIGNTWYESPDISALVQEVINRSDWQSGNALMLLHTRHPDITCCEFNDRTFKSYETGAENAPQLIITYSPQ